MAKLDKLVAKASEHLDDGEEILEAVDGTYETEVMGTDSARAGVLLATDNRLLFYAKKMTGFELESFSYKTISSFERGKSMMGGTLKFHASGNSVSMKWISAKNLDEFVSTVKSKMDEAQSGGGQSAPKDDPADQLRKLAELRDAGILSEEEFSAKKQEILDRM